MQIALALGSLTLLLASPALAAPLGEGTPLAGHPVTGLDGKPLDPKALAGKVILLDIWATWCDPCRASLPFYQDLQSRLGPQGLQVLAISVDERAEEVKRFLAKNKLSFLIGWDPKGAWPQRLQLSTMPTAWLIDRQGKIAHVHEGFHLSDQPKLEKQLRALLEQKP